jgi:hypothetical protein
MSEDYRFSVTIPGDMPADEREALVVVLRSHADVQELEARDPATIGLTLVAIMKDVAVVAGGVTAAASAAKALMELAEKINQWRRNARAHGQTPNARLERAGRAPLDLATARDEDVLAWLLDQPAR